jgi:hypothetical protein
VFGTEANSCRSVNTETYVEIAFVGKQSTAYVTDYEPWAIFLELTTA